MGKETGRTGVEIQNCRPRDKEKRGGRPVHRLDSGDE